jgi:hypothetical protein
MSLHGLLEGQLYLTFLLTQAETKCPKQWQQMVAETSVLTHREGKQIKYQRIKEQTKYDKE